MGGVGPEKHFFSNRSADYVFSERELSYKAG